MNVSKIANCSGCGVCSIICPTQAIEIKENKYGNLVAFVNDKCIECGKCVKVCPMYNLTSKKDIKDGGIKALSAIDTQVNMESSSGGVSTLIATYGLKNGYKIVGVKMDMSDLRAKFTVINKIEELEDFRKSKYLQAYTLPAVQKLIEECNQNLEAKFIVFGMPCQINGLYSLVNAMQIKNEIIYIDFFCHGVPSYRTWDKYIDEVKKKNDINDINSILFRDKSDGWHSFLMNIVGNNKYQKFAPNDLFYQAFFDNILLNKSCYDCRYRMGNTCADLRLGDFWGQKFKSNNKGVNACIIMNKRGDDILKNISLLCNEYKDIEINDCLMYQSIKPYEWTKNNDCAREHLQNNDNLKIIIKGYRKKLGIKYLIKQNLKRILYKLPQKMRNAIKEKI
ncbi:MAG: Coenzyme F420 hydrogenase/dehydrogenase, beta subunit C-terminal domain [Clostridia bacterium]